MSWNARGFLESIDRGEFDGRLIQTLDSLTLDQLLELSAVLERRSRTKREMRV